MIETERLRIHVASREEMEIFIAGQTVPDLKEAYGEMLQGSLDHPDEWDWYAIWMLEFKDGRHLGELCFRGIASNGSVEIGFGIDSAYRDNGYATEAVSAVVSWALQQKGVARVEAETNPKNFASQHVLINCGFVFAGITGTEGPRFIRSR